MKPSKPSLPASFGFAIRGIVHAFRHERNMKIHGAAAIMVVILAVLLKLDPIRWVFLVLAVGMVISAELINTAVEAVVDLASPDIHPLARAAKDTAAGAVLVCAVTAVVIGLIVFYGPLLSWMHETFQ